MIDADTYGTPPGIYRIPVSGYAVIAGVEKNLQDKNKKINIKNGKKSKDHYFLKVVDMDSKIR